MVRIARMGSVSSESFDERSGEYHCFADAGHIRVAAPKQQGTAHPAGDLTGSGRPGSPKIRFSQNRCSQNPFSEIGSRRRDTVECIFDGTDQLTGIKGLLEAFNHAAIGRRFD